MAKPKKIEIPKKEEEAAPEPEVKKPSPRYGGMQVLPIYKERLDPRFLQWYAKEFTNKRMIYGHWTAGHRNQSFPDYHRVVTEGTRNRPVIVNNAPVDQDLHAHTFGRNTGSCAVALAGFVGATSNDLGEWPVTKYQINAFVDAITEICLNHRIPVSQFMSHGEAADNIDQGPNPPYPTPRMSGTDAEPYGPLTTWERWDLHCQISPVTLWLFAPKGPKPPEHTVYFPDWIRGNVILNIQAATRKYWKGT